MCGGNSSDDEIFSNGDGIKLQDNVTIGMTMMDFDTLTPSR